MPGGGAKPGFKYLPLQGSHGPRCLWARTACPDRPKSNTWPPQPSSIRTAPGIHPTYNWRRSAANGAEHHCSGTLRLTFVPRKLLQRARQTVGCLHQQLQQDIYGLRAPQQFQLGGSAGRRHRKSELQCCCIDRHHPKPAQSQTGPLHGRHCSLQLPGTKHLGHPTHTSLQTLTTGQPCSQNLQVDPRQAGGQRAVQPPVIVHNKVPHAERCVGRHPGVWKSRAHQLIMRQGDAHERRLQTGACKERKCLVSCMAWASCLQMGRQVVMHAVIEQGPAQRPCTACVVHRTWHSPHSGGSVPVNWFSVSCNS